MHLLKPKDKSTPSVIVDSGGPSSQVDSWVNTEKTPDTWKPQDMDNKTKSSKKSAEKQVMSTPTTEIFLEAKGSSLEQEWDWFNQKLQGTPKASNTQEMEECKNPLHVHKDIDPKSINKQSTPMEEQSIMSQHTEIIPAVATSKIVLKVTEMPPLDAFYIPLHKVSFRRQRKRRRIDTPEFPPRNEPMDIVWKDIPFNPAENLTRLSQFT